MLFRRCDRGLLRFQGLRWLFVPGYSGVRFPRLGPVTTATAATASSPALAASLTFAPRRMVARWRCGCYAGVRCHLLRPLGSRRSLLLSFAPRLLTISRWPRFARRTRRSVLGRAASLIVPWSAVFACAFGPRCLAVSAMLVAPVIAARSIRTPASLTALRPLTALPRHLRLSFYRRLCRDPFEPAEDLADD